MWKLSALFKGFSDIGFAKLRKAKLAEDTKPKIPVIPQSVWDEIDRVKYDPEVEMKIKTALERIHQRLSIHFQDEPMYEYFTTGINNDLVRIEIRRNKLAEEIVGYRYKFYNLEMIMSKFDNPGYFYHLPVLSGGEHLIMRDILGPSTARYTKLMVSDAYEFLYAGIRRPAY
jgi:hypothetical protein